MNMRFLKSSEKKKLLKELEEQFGFTRIDLLLVETGKKKIRGFSGNMTREEIRELSGIANVEIVGMYLMKKEGQIRLSLDATGVLSEGIRKSVLEISDEELERWMNGLNLEIVVDKGIYVVKHKITGDFVGRGISDGKKVINYVPKERRIRKS